MDLAKYADLIVTFVLGASLTGVILVAVIRTGRFPSAHSVRVDPIWNPRLATKSLRIQSYVPWSSKFARMDHRWVGTQAIIASSRRVNWIARYVREDFMMDATPVDATETKQPAVRIEPVHRKGWNPRPAVRCFRQLNSVPRMLKSAPMVPLSVETPRTVVPSPIVKLTVRFAPVGTLTDAILVDVKETHQLPFVRRLPVVILRRSEPAGVIRRHHHLIQSAVTPPMSRDYSATISARKAQLVVPTERGPVALVTRRRTSVVES
jgi:hypothetical protein